MTDFDVIAFGEPLLRLTPPNFQRFEQTHLLERYIGGSELNTAVGLSRLGLEVAYFSRMADDPIGRLIARELIAQGVDTQEIIWTDEGRTGIYYMEEAKSPRSSQVTYDRAHSAISLMKPGHIPDDFLRQPSTRFLHLTGITLALSDTAYDTALALLDRAKEARIRVSFDVNHRRKLWSDHEAAEKCQPFMQQADVIFIAQRDARRLYDITAIEDLRTLCPAAIIIMTRGAQGAVALVPEGEVYEQGIYDAETVCRIGGGDAFSAGFLYAHARGLPVDDCLRYGAAAAALKYSLPGDLPLFDLSQIQHLLADHPHETVNR